jgi:hypothetical protein
VNDKLPPSLNRFAAELEHAIRRELGPRRDRRLGPILRARPRLLAGTTVGAAGTGVVLALVLSAAGSSPAFAVTRNHDGTVSLALLRSDGIVGANARLSALGIRAKIVPQAAGCGIQPVGSGSSNTVVAVVRSRGSSALQVQIAGQRLRIDPRKIPASKTLVIVARGTGQGVSIAAAGVSGAAPACLPPPITAAQQQSFLANAQCMRTHGVPNMPNPVFVPGGYGISYDVPAGSLAYEAKAILQASRACANAGTPLPLGTLVSSACGAQKVPPGGNSGNSGNSGDSGSVPPNGWTSQNRVIVQGCGQQGPPPSGNSGNSGNSGSGSSGNS